MIRIQSHVVLTFSGESRSRGSLLSEGCVLFGNDFINLATGEAWTPIYVNPLVNFSQSYHKQQRVLLPISAANEKFVVGIASKTGDTYEIVEAVGFDNNESADLWLRNLHADIVDDGFHPVSLMGRDWDMSTSSFGLFEFGKGKDRKFVIAVKIPE